MNHLAYFKDRIAKQGGCYFDDYMQMVLYDPSYGYYSTHTDIKRDFVTAPMLSMWFGRSFAHDWICNHSQLLKQGVFEWGSGRGDLMLSIMTWLYEQNQLPDRYVCVEPSPTLRALIERRLEGLPSDISRRVKICETFDQEIKGILISNELLDAMPCKRFVWSHDILKEQSVEVVNGELVFATRAPSAVLQHFFSKIDQPLVSPYCSEIQPIAVDWFQDKLDRLKGLFITIDYGYLRGEYYHPERHQGTLKMAQGHKNQNDPLFEPGRWDVTCHINFSDLIDLIADDMPYCFNTQAQYLADAGLIEVVSDQLTLEDKAALKTLMHPQQMGDVIKVLQVKTI